MIHDSRKLNGVNFDKSIINFTIYDCNVLSHISRGVTYRLWQELNNDCVGLIFLIDLNDRERFEEVKEQFYKTIENIPPECKILIVTSKNDLPNAMNNQEIIEELRLDNHEWLIDTFGLSSNNVEASFKQLLSKIAKEESK